MFRSLGKYFYLDVDLSRNYTSIICKHAREMFFWLLVGPICRLGFLGESIGVGLSLQLPLL